MLLHGRHDALLDVAGDLRVPLVVDPRHLLVTFGDDAHLRGGGPGAVAHNGRRDAGLTARLRERRGRVVGSGQRDERRSAAERCDVVSDVGRAADPMTFVIEHHDRHRGFWRDARHAARDELVEHGVAHHEHVGACHAGHEGSRPLRRERRQHRPGVPLRTAA